MVSKYRVRAVSATASGLIAAGSANPLTIYSIGSAIRRTRIVFAG